jgi:hypothetical protein
MKMFTVYKHPVNGYQAVKQGFCWPAFFFGGIWSLVSKMWGITGLILLAAILVSAVEISIASADAGSAALFSFVMSMGLAVIIGYNGNEWRSKNLIGKGYFIEKVGVSAANKDAAIAVAAGGV